MPYIKMNSKQIRPEIIKLPEVNIWENLHSVDLANGVLNVTPETLTAKSKNRQVGLHQTENFCTTKKRIHKVKRQPMV